MRDVVSRYADSDGGERSAQVAAILAAGLERLMQARENMAGDGPEPHVDFKADLPVTTDDQLNGCAEER